MANPHPKPYFKKGQPGGPGRPKLPQELKDFKKRFDPKVWESFTEILEGNYASLKKILKSGKTENLKRIVAQAIATADIDTLIKLHLIPNQKNTVIIGGDKENPLMVQNNLTDEQLLDIIARKESGGGEGTPAPQASPEELSAIHNLHET